MGYENLGIKVQNLRPAAARLEGLQEFSVDTTSEESRATNNLGNSGGGGGLTSLYGLYRYVRRQRVWIFSRFGLK